MRVGIQAVDDVLEDQRNADVGGLGQDQEGEAMSLVGWWSKA